MVCRLVDNSVIPTIFIGESFLSSATGVNDFFSERHPLSGGGSIHNQRLSVHVRENALGSVPALKLHPLSPPQFPASRAPSGGEASLSDRGLFPTKGLGSGRASPTRPPRGLSGDRSPRDHFRACGLTAHRSRAASLV